MKINDETIKKMFSEYAGRKDKEYSYFYGIITAGLGKTLLLGTLAAFTNKYYIIGINEEEIVLIGLGITGKPDGYSIIPKCDIKNIKISNWLFTVGKKLNIVLADGTKLKLKANYRCLGIKRQKENLIYIEELVSKEAAALTETQSKTADI